MTNKKNEVLRVVRDSGAGYQGQIRSLNSRGNPESIWVGINSSGSFDLAFEATSKYFNEHRNDDEIHLQELRIINPYGSEVAVLSPPHQSWTFKKDDFAEHDMSETVDDILSEIQQLKKRINLMFWTSMIYPSLMLLGTISAIYALHDIF